MQKKQNLLDGTSEGLYDGLYFFLKIFSLFSFLIGIGKIENLIGASLQQY